MWFNCLAPISSVARRISIYSVSYFVILKIKANSSGIRFSMVPLFSVNIKCYRTLLITVLAISLY